MTDDGMPSHDLPRPGTARWQPLRLGLVDLYHYDDEQFWFEDGRLLLRGNNGTGKSKVLALTLPFLLDGSTAPRRVEPDADPKKRMEWNLLLGGAHSHSERTGYAWIELGRRDAEGHEQFTTLGIGLKAAAGRGIVKSWSFVSSRRVGDLRLIDETRTVLGMERLREELTGAGQVYTTQESYRRAVDEALFRLGEERYAALVELLIRLRQPQLSKRPDEAGLSAALTDALKPLDQAVVADVAESFRSLEEEREGITDVKDTHRAAQTFLTHYRDYSRIASRRHTTRVRLTTSTYEHAGRDLAAAEGKLVAARAEVERVEQGQAANEESRGVLRGREQALRESPEMRDADRLDQAARTAEDLERRAAEAGIEADRTRSIAGREHGAAQEAADRGGDAGDEAGRREAEGERLATAAGLAAEHRQIAADDAVARVALARRREQVAHVRGLVGSAAAAAADAARQQTELDAAEAAAASRAEELVRAEEAVEAAVSSYRDRVRAHLAGLDELAPEPGLEELVRLAEDWGRSQQGESPVRVAVEAAAARAAARLGRERDAVERDRDQAADAAAGVRGRIADLESGVDPDPPAVPGREAAVRDGVRGAPLWQVTDFAESVPETDRAGLEAALQSAGLLDAWVFPDGTLRADGDVVLGPSGPVPDGGRLAEVLVPACPSDGGDLEPAVAEVLARIGLGGTAGAPLWVDADGGWGAGPARGSWRKDRAEHIGAGARESHRRVLVERLRAEADDQEQVAKAAQGRFDEAERRLGLVEAERLAHPADAEPLLVATHERAAAAGRERDRALEDAEQARAVRDRLVEAAGRARTELEEVAAELRVGATGDELDAVLDVVGRYELALSELRHARRLAVEAAAALAQARERAAEAEQLAERTAAGARALRTEAAGQRARAESLQQTVGESVADLRRRLAEVIDELTGSEQEAKRLSGERIGLAGRVAGLEQKAEELGVRRQEAAAERTRTIEELRAFAGTGLLRVALPDLPAPDAELADEWGITAALALARAAEQRLEHVDETDESWSRAQQRTSNASTELASQMSRHGHTASLEQRGDVMVARVRYLGDDVDVDRLADRLSVEVEDRERLLSAREREILENHLVNEVAGHLHELLLAAEGQLDRMNRELSERRTSTGMQLRVRWRGRGDGPAGLGAARELLVRSDATWTGDDRQAIGGFLQARIAEVREADPAGSWQEHLEHALDYRHWHSFVVERWQGGQWRSASGPASGGEKALAVSVPLFAAAASHYNSASPHAPRLILLDEAFAGVDDDSRAKSLGLLATFDLDVVMTSEREWGCYPEVPGLSIAQLSRVEGVDAVGVTRWRWNGARRERVGEVAEAARAGSAPDGPTEESLFG